MVLYVFSTEGEDSIDRCVIVSEGNDREQYDRAEQEAAEFLGTSKHNLVVDHQEEISRELGLALNPLRPYVG